MTRLSKIEGIGEAYAKKLTEAGVLSIENLLNKGTTAKGRKEIAQKASISETLILKWVNRADLFRVNGVGEQYADLLEAAGVDTIPELAQRKAENLLQKLVETNQAKKLVKKLPTLSQITGWIEQAKQLPRQITY